MAALERLEEKFRHSSAVVEAQNKRKKDAAAKFIQKNIETNTKVKELRQVEELRRIQTFMESVRADAKRMNKFNKDKALDQEDKAKKK